MAAPMVKMCAKNTGKITSLLDFCKQLRLGFTRYVSTKQSISRALGQRINPQNKLSVEGWVKSVRKQKEVFFIHISDGSCVQPLQIVASPEVFNNDIKFGSSISVEGSLSASNHAGQEVELHADRIDIVGHCDPVEFPFKARQKHTADYVRSYLHLRPKTNTFSSLLRVRNAASMAFHKFFQNEDFCEIHTPILVSTDCEGAGEVFRVEAGEKKKMDADESTEDGFFGHPTFLTVSGQLHLEIITGAMSKVYTFGPTFRAEKSQSRHHLAEFYMIEAELAFTQSLQNLMQVMEKMVRTTTHTLLDSANEDIRFYNKLTESEGHSESIAECLSRPFERMTYSEAIVMLQQSGQGFQFPVKWGCDLKKEHEQWLTDHIKAPVFVTDYPAELKPFYARMNPDEKTVSAVDLLVPGVGELIGGSLREERFDVLQARLKTLHMHEDYSWYLDLRKFGTVPHAGFGIGFERYLQFLLGTANIKDTIPFPRTHNNCKL